jgi:transposase
VRERATLERWARRPKSAQALALRCRIVLACADGLTHAEIAATLGCNPVTVGKWRRRFAADRLDGLTDAPRPGAARTIGDDVVESVLVDTLESAPPDATHWSTRDLATKYCHCKPHGLGPQARHGSPGHPERQPEAIQGRRRDRKWAPRLGLDRPSASTPRITSPTPVDTSHEGSEPVTANGVIGTVVADGEAPRAATTVVVVVGSVVVEVVLVGSDVVAVVVVDDVVVVVDDVVVVVDDVVVVVVVGSVVMVVVGAVVVEVLVVDVVEVVVSWLWTGTSVVVIGVRTSPVDTTVAVHCTERTASPLWGAVVSQVAEGVVWPVVNGPGKLSGPQPVPVGEMIDQPMSSRASSP